MRDLRMAAGETTNRTGESLLPANGVHQDDEGETTKDTKKPAQPSAAIKKGIAHGWRGKPTDKK